MKPCPKPTKAGSEKQRRKKLEKQLEAASKELVIWRDGDKCVLSGMDGGRCNGVLQWGHLIPQKTSPWLVYAIGNTFRQCQSHNVLHYYRDPIFGVWYASTFGAEAWRKISQEHRDHIKIARKIWELEEMLEHYQYMLDNRPALHTFDLLVELGYYGEWTK